MLGGVDERDRPDREPGIGPGGEAAVELAEDRLVADGEALADEVDAVGAVVEDEHHGPVEGDQPTEPAGEHRSVLDRDRPQWMRLRERGDGAGIDERGTIREVTAHGVDVEAREGRDARGRGGDRGG